jgi:hypothetical protein
MGCWSKWDVGGCGCTCAGTVTFCTCTNVPKCLSLSSTLYGSFTLVWNAGSGTFISNVLTFNYPGSAGCPSACAALSGCQLRFVLSCPSGTSLVFVVQTIGSLAGPCPINNTGSTWQTRDTYSLGARTCSPFGVVGTLGTNTSMACGPGDTVTITP